MSASNTSNEAGVATAARGVMTSDATGEVLWAALANDTGVPVMLVDRRGLVLRANECWDRLAGVSVGSRSMADLLGAEFAAERLGIIDRVLASGRPMRLVEMVRGVLLYSTYRPYSPGRTDQVLITSRVPRVGEAGEPRPDSKVEMQVSTTADMGRLGALTDRELELLHHIGMGRSSDEAAKLMHRSTRTVEWHRASLGQKLRCENRVELARIAIESGITAVDVPFLAALRKTGRPVKN